MSAFLVKNINNMTKQVIYYITFFFIITVPKIDYWPVMDEED